MLKYLEIGKEFKLKINAYCGCLGIMEKGEIWKCEFETTNYDEHSFFMTNVRTKEETIVAIKDFDVFFERM